MFFDEVKHGLQAGVMELHFHHNVKKTYGTFGMQCRRCGMTIVLEWPQGLAPSESSIAQQLLASFVHPQPYQAALMDQMPEEPKWCTLLDDDERLVDSKVWEVDKTPVEAN